MGVAIPGDGPLNVKRTLGSMVPHPAAIGKIMGARLGIATPRTHLAGGGIPQQSGILQNMFQPISPGGNVPSADINFISSPQLSSGAGPGVAKANSTPQQQPSTAQDVAQGTQAASGLTNLYKGASGILGGSGNNPSMFGSISSGLQGNGFGGILSGPNAQSANWMAGSNSFAPGASLDTLGSGATNIAVDSAAGTATALPAAADLGASIAASAAPAAIADAGATAGMAGLADTSAAAFGSSIMDMLPALFAMFADGGAIPEYADGGEANSLTNMLMRREAGETFHPSGLLNSAGPGRTDTINTNVPTGAYVVPADVVSGLGEGNTLAGSAVIDRMFSTQPHGLQARPIREGRGVKIPTPPSSAYENNSLEPQSVDTSFINSAGAYAKGGKADDKAPVIVAGGEHVISPKQIINKFGSLKKGHKILDHWVLLQREKHIKDLKKLDVPVGSGLKK